MEEGKKNPFHYIILATSIIGGVITVFDFLYVKIPRYGLLILIVVLIACWVYVFLHWKTSPPAPSKKVGISFDKFLLYLIPLIVFGLVIAKIYERNRTIALNCDDNKKEMTVGIARFSRESNANGELSLYMIDKMRENTDSLKEKISIKSIPAFIDYGLNAKKRYKALIDAAESECIKNGIITYGYVFQSGSSLPRYGCFLFIKQENLSGNLSKAEKALDNLNLKVKLPVEIAIEESADIFERLSDVISGMILTYNGEISNAKKYLAQVYNHDLATMQIPVRFASHKMDNDIPKSSVEDLANFYMGILHVIEQNEQEAIRSFYEVASGKSILNNLDSLALFNLDLIQQNLDPPSDEDTSDAETSEPTAAVKPSRVPENNPPKRPANTPDQEPRNNQVEETPEPQKVEQDVLPEDDVDAPLDEIDTSSAVAEQEVPEIQWVRWTRSPKGAWIVRTKDYSWYALADDDYNILTKRHYHDVKEFKNEQYYAIVNLDNKFGFIDWQGNETIAPQYDGVRNFSNGLAAVRINGLWGFLNSRNQIVIQPRFKQIIQDFRRESAVVVDGKKAIWINKKGEKLRNAKFN